ncbi:DUF3168 domain-containing protein [Paenibacillus alvei]|uniref:DUF3168 domain-containing protein n=1 Tax=Paenibacillus alvei TaxID=44250 RepID=A0ABT4H7Q5_PAEAL|nr:DUF3168 domain-containing protein [Paenibacillus alvei]EJW14156.1 putative phage protein [Paenibacillus alvei DSM 29]MCY9539173.1 DUF3168 domain-containing protein [Paenibacillus alvei]MCY9705906.1 DUF3168 domain-containing protein [Paenibacillus alvei]MCY9737961.1 DUF3168 domain-containing protein [Paenibacillus alvei]MCY9765016.1 DUF3168 domain-containing protein [Paenibacillus alvei]
MIDLKPKIIESLLGNDYLINLLGGEFIWPEVAPDDPPDAYLTFFELSNLDRNYADDEAMTSEIHIQVDVWSRGNTGPISIEANRVMEQLGFVRTGANDRYEKETGTYRKILRFKTIVRR